MRSLTHFVLMLALTVSACSSQTDGEWRTGPEPSCDTTSRGRLLLIAQSVPDATLIPCVDELPPGWELSSAFSRSSESVLVFETDTFDLDVVVRLLPSCDVSSALLIDSPRASTRFFVDADASVLSFVFTGGCIMFEYETRQLAESQEGRALLDAVPFMTRDTLRELSGWTL